MNIYPNLIDKTLKGITDWILKVTQYRAQDVTDNDTMVSEIQALQTEFAAIAIPVPAAGSDIDTGTDNAKYVTAAALKASKNVPDVAPGTSGNYLSSNGTNWISAAFPTSGITVGTPVATTSGTSVAIATGIPATAKQIIITIKGLSTSGTSGLLVQIGPTAGVVATGYTSAGFVIAGSVASNSSTAGFISGVKLANTEVLDMTITLNLENSTTNTWVATGLGGAGAASRSYGTNGAIALAGPLAKVSLTTVNGTDTFTAGSVNVSYQ